MPSPIRGELLTILFAYLFTALHNTGNAIMNQIDQLTAIERIRNTKAHCFR